MHCFCYYTISNKKIQKTFYKNKILFMFHTENNVWTLVAKWTVCVLTRGLLCCIFPDKWNKEENIYQNNTHLSGETICNECIYIISLLHNIFDNKKTIFTQRLRASIALKTLCWWRHYWLQNALCLCRGHLRVISNSLGIDLVNVDIHV